MIVALVPVKGKSNRLPGKNLREVHGIPLFCYTLRSLSLSPLVDKIIVSTESAEVKEIALKLDMLVDDRPEFLAKDPMEVADVLQHFILHRLHKYGPDVDGLLLAQPNLLVLPETINFFCQRYAGYRKSHTLHEVVSMDPNTGCDNGALRLFDPARYLRYPHSVYQMFLPTATVAPEIHDEEDLTEFRDRLVRTGLWGMINDLKDTIDG